MPAAATAMATIIIEPENLSRMMVFFSLRVSGTDLAKPS